MKYIITLITCVLGYSVFGAYVSQNHSLYNVESKARAEKVDCKNSKK
jgi:hypothetical protein